MEPSAKRQKTSVWIVMERTLDDDYKSIRKDAITLYVFSSLEAASQLRLKLMREELYERMEEQREMSDEIRAQCKEFDDEQEKLREAFERAHADDPDAQYDEPANPVLEAWYEKRRQECMSVVDEADEKTLLEMVKQYCDTRYRYAPAKKEWEIICEEIRH
jgi:hypothetical protein